MADKEERPIIVKRRYVVSEEGHHGGAWKVAYADFVTAMMAFFLLMWLLNATTEKQRKGLADYFAPTLPINKISGGGDGNLYGDSAMATDVLSYNGTGATDIRRTEDDKASGDTGFDTTRDKEEVTTESSLNQSKALLEDLKARGGESMEALLEKRHVISKLSDEGLVLEFRDLPDDPLFDDKNEPTYAMQSILNQLAKVVELVDNKLGIAAHLAAQPVVVADNRIWANTSDRAMASFDVLGQTGMDMGRIKRVTGMGDGTPSHPDPMDVTNNRVEVVFLLDPE